MNALHIITFLDACVAEYQKGYVFSTRFGADFFSLTLQHILNNQPIVPEKGEKLGEYDKNFNEWMKIYC